MLDAPELAPLLDVAEIAYLAVESKHGPMVTPLLFTVRDGRLWMVMPRSSAKVGAIGRDRRVGVAAGSLGGAMALVQGEARIVDPLDPRSLVGSIPETLLSPRALGSYVTGHLAHLAGMVGPAMLEPRAAAAVRPERALAVRAGAALWSSGDWSEADPPDGGSAERLPLRLPADVPDELRRATAEAGPVLVGWTTATGPVVLPGEWDPRRSVAAVRLDLFIATGGLPRSAACVLFDTTEGTSLAGKAGLVVRGRGLAREQGENAELTVDTERISWWRGDDARTVEAG
ncbi:MAG TPA: hypothetical protein VM933_04635 [Acidimicrobiales bacterium]|nr:hypothetical protein [Acidimicrobiales bacterium]